MPLLEGQHFSVLPSPFAFTIPRKHSFVLSVSSLLHSLSLGIDKCAKGTI